MSPAYARLWNDPPRPLTRENVGEAIDDMRLRLQPGQIVEIDEEAQRMVRDYFRDTLDEYIPRAEVPRHTYGYFETEGSNRMASRFYISNHHIIEVLNDHNVWVTPLFTGEQTYRANFYPEINVAMTPEGMKKAKFALFPKHERIKMIKAVEFKDKNFTGFKPLEEFSELPRNRIEEYCEGYIANTQHIIR